MVSDERLLRIAGHVDRFSGRLARVLGSPIFWLFLLVVVAFRAYLSGLVQCADDPAACAEFVEVVLRDSWLRWPHGGPR